jgi:hypothetical protein
MPLNCSLQGKMRVIHPKVIEPWYQRPMSEPSLPLFHLLASSLTHSSSQEQLRAITHACSSKDLARKVWKSRLKSFQITLCRLPLNFQQPFLQRFSLFLPFNSFKQVQFGLITPMPRLIFFITMIAKPFLSSLLHLTGGYPPNGQVRLLVKTVGIRKVSVSAWVWV